MKTNGKTFGLIDGALRSTALMRGSDMEEYVDKEKLMDDVIDNISVGYTQLLACQIKDEGFSSKTYVEPNDIISICDLAINSLINTFEQVVTELLTSVEDVKEFMHIYSSSSNPTSKKPIIFRHTCSYILSVLPKLQLTSEPSEKEEEHKMMELCKLIALTKLLHSFIQAKSIQIIEQSVCLKIEIGLFIVLEYTKQEIITLNSTLANSVRLIHKNFASEEDFKDLMSTLEDNSPTLKTLFDYVSNLITRQADIFEVTREINNCKSDPIIEGLTFTIDNVNLYEAIHSPYKIFYRTRFRPILQLNIDGEVRFFTTPWMILETFDEISNNLLPYNELPEGWQRVHDLKQLCKKVTKQAGKLFEDEVFKIVDPQYIVKRNISGFHTVSLKKQVVPNTKRKVGEIDFIIIDTKRKIIFVIDAKCTKTKFYFQSFANDKDTFEKYSIKLNDKVEWISSHKNEVGKFFKVSNIHEYTVEGVFVTNSLIYYNFFSHFPIIPLDKLLSYIEESDRMCVIA